MKFEKVKFTLIELIIVIAVVGVLMSILMPSLRNAKHRAHIAVDLSNHKQIYLAMLAYASQNNNRIIVPNDVYSGRATPSWRSYVGGTRNFLKVKHIGHLYIENYLTNHQVFYCPSARGQKKYRHHTGTDGKWMTNSGRDGNRPYSSYSVNYAKYPQAYETDHLLIDDQMSSIITNKNVFRTSTSHAPLIYGEIIDEPALHGNMFPLTNLDGSGKIYRSSILETQLNLQTNNFGRSHHDHTWALYMIMGNIK